MPIVYDVDTLREGRSFAHPGACSRDSTAGRSSRSPPTFQIPEQGLEHQDPIPAEVPPPEACPTLAEASPGSGRDSAEWEREWSALDVRHAGDSRPGGAIRDQDSAANVRLWIRVNGTLPDDPLSHTAAFTYASDMTLLAATLVPHGRYIASPDIQAASLDHAAGSTGRSGPTSGGSTTRSRRRPPGGAVASARVFAQDGRLVATIAQEALIRLRAESP